MENYEETIIYLQIAVHIYMEQECKAPLSHNIRQALAHYIYVRTNLVLCLFGLVEIYRQREQS